MANPSERSLVVRPSRLEDLQRIHEIAVGGWTPIFNRYRMIVGDRMWNDMWGGWEQNWFPPTPDRHNDRAIVTEVDGQVAGFATWWFPGERFAEVGGNAVDPAYQGLGIGSKQIQWVVSMFRERGYTCAKVHTGMDPAHGPARAEYRKAGLRRRIFNSVYLNYLDEVARIPVRGSRSCRWASPEDRLLLDRFARAAWQPIYDSVREAVGETIFPLAFPNALEKKTTDCLKALEQGPDRVRIVSENSKAAGFAVLSYEAPKKVGEISALAVAPDFQGRGIGAALCMDVFDLFRERGLHYVRLKAGLGEVTWQSRQMCWNVGLYRELPSVDYYMML